MEEISKGQVIKWLICFAQELAIFPEGTLCVCVCVCVCVCTRTRMHVRGLSDLRFLGLLLLQHRNWMGGGNLENWSKVISLSPFPILSSMISQPFRSSPSCCMYSLNSPLTSYVLGHCSPVRLSTPMNLNSFFKAKLTKSSYLVLSAKISKCCNVYPYCTYYFKWSKLSFELS